MACCINLTYEVNNIPYTEELTTAGVFNGSDYFEFTGSDGIRYFIWYNSPPDQWLITPQVGDLAGGIIGGTKQTLQTTCPPNGINGQGIWELPNQLAFWDGYMIAECVVDCPCLKLTIEADLFPEQTITSYNYFVANGRKHFKFEYNGIDLVIYYDGTQWQCSNFLNNAQNTVYVTLKTQDTCPIAEFVFPPNLIKNGSFSQGNADWNIGPDWVIQNQSRIQSFGDSSTQYLSQVVPDITVGKSYLISYFVYTNTLSNNRLIMSGTSAFPLTNLPIIANASNSVILTANSAPSSGFEFRIANSSSNSSGEIIIGAFEVVEQIDQSDNWDMPPNSAFQKLVTFKTEGVDCPNPCPCVGFIYQDYVNTTPTQVDLTDTAGGYNGFAFWSTPYPLDAGKCFYIWMFINENGGCQWAISLDECNSTDPRNGILLALLGVPNFENCEPCPYGLYTNTPEGNKIFSTNVNIIDCAENECDYLEDRIEKFYDAIRFPVVFEEEEKGWIFSCCETFLVLADPFSDESYKNDVNSAWCKLSDPQDTVEFKLYKDGIETNYQPTKTPFVNEPNAFYATIFWKEVLQNEGIGCYTWKVEYNISGVISNFVWGIYSLKQYSIATANQTARVRVKFNLIQAIEGINFTDSNVEDSLRFFGYIGERQPNMEIDNLIYQDRTMKSVIRQNLNEYTITTDPAMDDITRKLCDLYLLSENEMFISDYNIVNHSYRYQDLPVIVSNTPEINYIDTSQRKAIVKCVVSDRTKNQRTFF